MGGIWMDRWEAPGKDLWKQLATSQPLPITPNRSNFSSQKIVLNSPDYSTGGFNDVFMHLVQWEHKLANLETILVQNYHPPIQPLQRVWPLPIFFGRFCTEHPSKINQTPTLQLKRRPLKNTIVCTLSMWHYVLRGGGSEKCCDLQKPIHTSGPLGWVMIYSLNIVQPWGTPFFKFYGHFMTFFWPRMAIFGHRQNNVFSLSQTTYNICMHTFWLNWRRKKWKVKVTFSTTRRRSSNTTFTT